MQKAWGIRMKKIPHQFIDVIMGIILRSDSWFLIIFLFFYAFGLIANNLWAAMLLFLISGLILLAPLTIKNDSPKYTKNQPLGTYLLLLHFMPFAAYSVFSRYSDQIEASAFKSYLIRHECQNHGETFPAPAGCDEIDCLEYETIEYTCRGNKKINSYIFKIGREAGFYK